mgnify:CR=1 FL=1
MNVNFNSASMTAFRFTTGMASAAFGEVRFHATSAEGHRAHDCSMEVLSVVAALTLEVADSASRYAKSTVTNVAINAWDAASRSYYTRASVQSIESAWEVITPVWEFNSRAFVALFGLAVYTAAFACAWLKVYCDNTVEKALAYDEAAELPEEFPIVEPMAKCVIESGRIVRSWVAPVIPSAPATVTGVQAEVVTAFALSFLATEGGYSTMNEYAEALGLNA